MQKTILTEVLYWAGGAQALAAKIGRERAAVYYWIRVGRVPAKPAKAIETASEGRFQAIDLASFAPKPRPKRRRRKSTPSAA